MQSWTSKQHVILFKSTSLSMSLFREYKNHRRNKITLEIQFWKRLSSSHAFSRKLDFGTQVLNRRQRGRWRGLELAGKTILSFDNMKMKAQWHMVMKIPWKGKAPELVPVEKRWTRGREDFEISGLPEQKGGSDSLRDRKWPRDYLIIKSSHLMNQGICRLFLSSQGRKFKEQYQRIAIHSLRARNKKYFNWPNSACIGLGCFLVYMWFSLFLQYMCTHVLVNKL